MESISMRFKLSEFDIFIFVFDHSVTKFDYFQGNNSQNTTYRVKNSRNNEEQNKKVDP